MEVGRRWTPSVLFEVHLLLIPHFWMHHRMRFFVLGRQPFVPWFLARAALTKVRAHGSRENRSSLQSAIIYIYKIMISRCIIWILYGLWLINIHKPLLLSTSHPQDTPARPRSWVWVSPFVAPAKAQYLGGGDPWPWDIGGVYHGKSCGDGGNMGVDRCFQRGWTMSILYTLSGLRHGVSTQKMHSLCRKWWSQPYYSFISGADINLEMRIETYVPHFFHWQPK